MAKETYYFSHDANARNDENILMLRSEHGWEGYGIYWALVEMMFESAETELSMKKLKGLSVSYNIDITLLKQVINTCISEGLFVIDEDENFWSESLRRRKQKYIELKEKRSAAGKKGMANRYSTNFSNSVITEPNSVITEPNKVNEIKGNEIKGNTSKIDADALDIFEYYISKEIIIHKDFTTSMKGKVKTAIKNFGKDEVKKIIDNYATVVKGNQYYFNTEYTLEKLMRPKDLSQFSDEAKPLQNFLRDKGESGKNNKTTPSIQVSNSVDASEMLEGMEW